MKFSTREDIGRPADEVFAAVSDFTFFEDLLRQRGVTVERIEDCGPAVGTAWKAKAVVRGRHLTILSQVVTFRAQDGIAISSTASGLETLTEVEITPLTSKKSRLAVAVDIRPTSFKGRLFLQPLKLAKGKLSDRFRSGIARFAKDVGKGRSGPS
jgi:hypothetical protein